jgi:hypothetical protein
MTRAGRESGAARSPFLAHLEFSCKYLKVWLEKEALAILPILCCHCSKVQGTQIIRKGCFGRHKFAGA